MPGRERRAEAGAAAAARLLLPGVLGKQGQVFIPGEAYRDASSNPGTTATAIDLDLRAAGRLPQLALTGTEPLLAGATAGLVLGTAVSAAVSVAAALAAPSAAGR